MSGESRPLGIDRPTGFDGVFNFRDLGGLAVGDGVVAPGRMFRSDSLDDLSTRDVETLAGLGIRTVVDLRAEGEGRKADPAPIPGCRRVSLPLAYDPWDRDALLAAPDPAAYIADRYAEIAADGERSLAALLDLLTQPETAPVVVSCGFGKDRTGLAVAVVLGLVGVADEAIAADFALSEAGIERMRAAAERTSDPGLEARLAQDDAFLRAPRQAIVGFLDGLRDRCGSLPGYALELGLTEGALARLRASLVEGCGAAAR